MVEPNELDSNIAPALQAAQERLQRAQLEDKLGHALQERPEKKELVERNILKGDALILKPSRELRSNQMN